MKPPGKTNLTRMQLAAQREAERIEITQDARVQERRLNRPLPSQVRLRDDFAGIVRLIDMIQNDEEIMWRLDKIAKAAPPLPDAETGADEEVMWE